MTTTHGADPRLVRRPPLSRSYVSRPCYEPAGGVSRGWAAAAATLPADVRTLAVDGPAAAGWERITAFVSAELTARSPATRIQVVDMRAAGLPWAEIRERTRSDALGDDPDFEMLAGGDLADLIDMELIPADAVPGGAIRLVIGPGAALAAPDVLWWAELPKRYAEAAATAGHGRNLLAPADLPATTRRLSYVDWPLRAIRQRRRRLRLG